jgi:hypothetical protein
MNILQANIAQNISKMRQNCCLNKLLGFMKIFGRITTRNLVEINIITSNYAYYKIVQLTLQNEYLRAPFFLKTYIRCIGKCYLKKS